MMKHIHEHEGFKLKLSQIFLSHIRFILDLRDFIFNTVIGIQKEKFLKGKNKTEQIKILDKLGLSNDAIALIVNTTPSTVRVRRSEIKRKRKKKAK